MVPPVRRSIARIILSLVFLCTTRLALAEPVTTIESNGDSANRIDIVFLGDGYRASELAKFALDTQQAANGMLAQAPFSDYRRYFNVHRVDVISAESGADHPESSVYRDTALDATYNCNGIQRLICVNGSKLSNVLNNSALLPNQRDIVVVLVNDPQYGGSGGAYSVASTHSAAIELVLHETGHTFGRLADEYDYGGCPTTYWEPYEPNVTLQTDRSLIKWNTGGGPPWGWIEPSTPLPTSSTAAAVLGLYTGARYCPNFYRPTYDSKMRNLGRRFEQINEEQLIKRFYNLVSTLDAVSPADTGVVTPQGERQVFSATVPTPSYPLEIAWFVDGTIAGSGAMFTLDSASLTQGTHTVSVKVSDRTAKVRNDPAGVMFDVRTWTVDVQAPLLGEIRAPTPGSTLTSTSATFQWAATGAMGYWLDIGSTPGGYDIVDKQLPASTTSTTIDNLPADGRTVYVRLWTRLQSGQWQYRDYTYTAYTRPAGIYSPAPASNLSSTSVTFHWQQNGAASYWLDVGSRPGGSELHNAGFPGAATQAMVSNIPLDGRVIYVRWWYYLSSTWRYLDYEFRTVSSN